MAKIIDMQSMRQLNLFTKISHIQTKYFFEYNNALIFGVPRSKVSQAIGKDASNVRKLNQILRKKIKVIAMPKDGDNKSIEQFVISLVAPVEINKIEILDHRMEINATRINKASLIGRNRSREKELTTILKNNFNIDELRIV